MGMRQYDCTTGRFLSVDPLFEKFREQTPYQYAFNNPVSFKDPTGLEPESEKGGEDMMLMQGVQDLLAEQNAVSNEMSNRYLSFTLSSLLWECSVYGVSLRYEIVGGVIYGQIGPNFNSGGGGSSSGARTGVQNNPGYPTNGLEKAVDSKVRKSLINADNLPEDEWNKKVENFMTSFWLGNARMSFDDFTFYMSVDFHIYIGNKAFVDKSKLEENEDAIGWHQGDGKESCLWFRDSYFDGSWTKFGYYNVTENYDIQQVIMHEFGHSYAIYSIGNQYKSWHSNFKENWAIEFSNSRYSNFVGRPNEIFYWTFQINISRWINFLYPSTGGRGWNP